MTLSRDSLSGQNSQGRLSGARSSRALSTIFQRLRKLDRQIGELDYRIRVCTWDNGPELSQRRKTLDEKRKIIRNQRKRYILGRETQTTPEKDK